MRSDREKSSEFGHSTRDPPVKEAYNEEGSKRPLRNPEETGLRGRRVRARCDSGDGRPGEVRTRRDTTSAASNRSKTRTVRESRSPKRTKVLAKIRAILGKPSIPRAAAG